MKTTPNNSSTTTKNSDLTINAYIAANAEYDTACQAANAAYEIAFDAANTARDEIRATARAVRDAAHAAADAAQAALGRQDDDQGFDVEQHMIKAAAAASKVQFYI